MLLHFIKTCTYFLIILGTSVVAYQFDIETTGEVNLNDNTKVNTKIVVNDIYPESRKNVDPESGQDVDPESGQDINGDYDYFIDPLREYQKQQSNEQEQQFNESRINGGQLVTKIVPYQISMQLRRRGASGGWRHFCAGSIISANHVLTAAHCVNKRKAEDISIVGGTLNWKVGGDRHNVIALHVHPKFAMQPHIINDIAIVKIATPLNLQKTDTIAAINLGGPRRVGGNVAVRLTGWGSITPSASPAGLPEQLQMLNYHTISNENCNRKGFRVSPKEVCALAAKGQGACVGDSGGPLVTTPLGTTPQLVGIVSYGTAKCAQGKPDVYTRVSSFLPFINKVITNEMP